MSPESNIKAKVLSSTQCYSFLSHFQSMHLSPFGARRVTHFGASTSTTMSRALYTVLEVLNSDSGDEFEKTFLVEAGVPPLKS